MTIIIIFIIITEETIDKLKKTMERNNETMNILNGTMIRNNETMNKLKETMCRNKEKMNKLKDTIVLLAGTNHLLNKRKNILKENIIYINTLFIIL